MADSRPPAVKVNVNEIAQKFRDDVKRTINEKYGGKGPKLVAFLANSDPHAKKYAEWTGKACEADGIRYELREVAEYDLEKALSEANADPEVHGVLIYYPVFGGSPSFYGGSMDDYLRDSVSYKKDVEGLSLTYRFNLYRNIRYMGPDLKCLLPCTALSVVKILEGLNVYDANLPIGDRMVGKTVTIINRSEIVGRPLAALLANDGADIYSVDLDSIYLFRRGKLSKTNETPESAVKKSDVVVTGVPVPTYRLPTSWISPNTIVVNVASHKNVDESDLLKVPGVTYVPLVGKVTVAMLERNLLRLYEQYHAANAPGKDFRYYISDNPAGIAPRITEA